jgi:hypothetical protein
LTPRLLKLYFANKYQTYLLQGGKHKMNRIANLYDIDHQDKKKSIYDFQEIAHMLEEDDLDAIEAGFMLGYLAT